MTSHLANYPNHPASSDEMLDGLQRDAFGYTSMKQRRTTRFSCQAEYIALKRIKEDLIRDLGAAQRRIDQGEQEFWMPTGSDPLDSMTVEMKVGDIETLKGDQRIAFIR